MTCLSGKSNWQKICADIQERSLNQTLLEVESAREFKTEIFHCLNRASNEKILSANQKEIRGLLKKGASSQINKKGYTEIMGGGKNFNRTQDIPHFKLHNGC